MLLALSIRVRTFRPERNRTAAETFALYLDCMWSSCQKRLKQSLLLSAMVRKSSHAEAECRCCTARAANPSGARAFEL